MPKKKNKSDKYPEGMHMMNRMMMSDKEMNKMMGKKKMMKNKKSKMK